MSAPASAPPARRTGRTVAAIAGVGIVLVVVAVVLAAITRSPQRPADFLSPESGSPLGTRAIAEVLRDRGVDVRLATSLADLDRLVENPSQATIAVYDAALVLTPTQRERVLGLADRLVVFEPWDDELAVFAPGVVLGVDQSTGPVDADCDLPAAVRAERIDTLGTGYDVSAAEDAVTGCFETATGEFAVVQTVTAGTDVTIVGAAGAFTNAEVLQAGNAAFALNLLGVDETLVWYLPGLADAESGDALTPLTATPDWLSPLLVLLVGGVVALGVWQGRRLGPLVRERLPVLVRSNETMEGRARLYERAGARAHTLDALRTGTLTRLATLAGLPRRASAAEIVDAVAALTGRDRREIAELLTGTEPNSDADLVRRSDDLLTLEADLTWIVRGR